MNGPLVSVLILNYRRREALERCIGAALAQSYPAREVIVVDNGSQEDLSGIAARDGSVRVIQLAENLGACAGRNAGIRAARGDLVVTLDNDVLLATPFELERIVEAFDRLPAVGVIAFKVCEMGTGKLRAREWCHPRDWRTFADVEFETYFITEGASAFRRLALTGREYWEPLFIGCEGYDLSLRILAAGWRIVYCPTVRVFHMMSSEMRESWRPYYFYTRNYIWIAFKNLPAFALVGYLIGKLGMMLAFAIRAGHLAAYGRGIRDGLRGIRNALSVRAPIDARTLNRVERLSRERPGIIVRLMRHREATQI